jgi:capsular exopolysaccharide synthesis family protein
MDNPRLLDDANLQAHEQQTATLVSRAHYIEAPYAEAMGESRPNVLLEYWDVVRRRWTSLLLAAFAGLVGALLFTVPQTPIYRARASLEIQNLNDNFLNLRDVNPTTSEGPAAAPEYELQTEVQILQSESVLDQVIAKLSLAQRFVTEEWEGRTAAWRKVLGLPGPQPDTREQLLRRVSKNLTIQAQAKTRLIEIFYNSPDPQLASDIANALTTEFIQQNLESRWKTTQQTGKWLTGQMQDTRIKLERAEDELQRYAASTGLVFASEEDNIAEEKLRQLQEELSTATADRVTAQSKYESASKASPESLPEVLDDKTFGDLQVRLADLRRQLAELSSTLTPAHPSVKKVQAQVTALQAALDTKRNAIVQRIQNEYQAAQRRETLLARNYAAQAQLVSGQAAKVAHYNILKREVDTNRDLYDSMLRSVQDAGVSSALRASNVRVVDSAFPPTHRYRPSYPINMGLGLLAGVFFGTALIVMLEHADRTIQSPGEVSLSLGVPELGVIPAAGSERSRYFSEYHRYDALPSDSGNGHAVPAASSGRPRLLQAESDHGNGHGAGGRSHSVELVSAGCGPSVLNESFRATLTSIMFSGENGNRPRTIVITSANPSDGKTTVASNLALALANTGSRVLLIDADLRRGQLHKVYQVPNDWGLSSVLMGAELPEGRASAYVETAYARLLLLPTGPTPPNVTALLYSPRVQELLGRVREEFHTVIIDSPPMMNMADARLLGKMADAVVLVVRAQKTSRDAAKAMVERLTADGSRILGTVLNQWDPRKVSQARYGYGYGYGYNYPYYRSYQRY